jgi:putative transposase
VKGAFSMKTIMTMTFKLMQNAQKRWHRLRGFQQLDNVIKGVLFKDGILVKKINNESTKENLIQDAA